MTLPVTRTDDSYFLFRNTGHVVIYKMIYMYRNKKEKEVKGGGGVI